jgi:hypothetical protein
LFYLELETVMLAIIGDKIAFPDAGDILRK